MTFITSIHGRAGFILVSRFFWAEIYWGRLIFMAESSLIQSSCRSFIGVIVPKIGFVVKITDVNSDVCNFHSDFRSGIICFIFFYRGLS
jgi:hypothetical protein